MYNNIDGVALLIHGVICNLFVVIDICCILSVVCWFIMYAVMYHVCLLIHAVYSLLFIGSSCMRSVVYWSAVYNCSVNVDVYENLVSMGFNRRFAAEALKLSNNDLNEALQVS